MNSDSGKRDCKCKNFGKIQVNAVALESSNDYRCKQFHSLMVAEEMEYLLIKVRRLMLFAILEREMVHIHGGHSFH